MHVIFVCVPQVTMWEIPAVYGLEREPTKEEILTELENEIYLIMSNWYTVVLVNLRIDWKISNGFLQKYVKQAIFPFVSIPTDYPI